MRGWSDASETPGQLIQNEHEHKRGVSEASDHPRMTSPRDIHAEEMSCAGGLMPLRLHAYAHAHSVLTGPEPDQGVPGGLSGCGMKY
jgi:hypothetical protein